MCYSLIKANMTFYLYHWVPPAMEGDIIHPLNILKEKYPKVYEEKAAKYKGRELTMHWKIPPLNCLWNDVLHFTAIHPNIVKEALREAGDKRKYELVCYQLDPHLLDPKDTIVCLYTNEPSHDTFDPSDFVEFNSDEIEKYSEVSERTKAYYKRMFDAGKDPLVFPWCTHILFKGSLDVKNLPIVRSL